MRQLKHSELVVFLVLYRFTAGYLRSWTCIGETLLLQMTGLSASTLYEAKKGLRAKGYLEVKHMVSGRCEYRICEGLDYFRGCLAGMPGRRGQSFDVPEAFSTMTWQ